jgi:hypothetical protein
MLCSYLIDIYENHIQPNLIDDELIYCHHLFEHILTESIKEFNLIEDNFDVDYDMLFYKKASNDILLFNKEYKIGFNYVHDAESMWVSYNIFKLDTQFDYRNGLYKFIRQQIITKFPQYKILRFHIFYSNSIYYINAKNFLKEKYAL